MAVDWDDMLITPDEYIQMFVKTAKQSSFFSEKGWKDRWHPEDLHYQFDAVFESFGNALMQYFNVIREHQHNNYSTSNDIYYEVSND